MTLNAAKLEALYTKFMGKGAGIIGDAYTVKRPTALSDVSTAPQVGSVLASFSQNYNYNRAPKWDDVIWNTIVDPSQIQVGDLLVGAYTYFVASLDPLLPPGCVRCTVTAEVVRPNAETATGGGPATGALPTAGGGHYFGKVRTPQASPTAGPGMATRAQNVPCLMIANAGRATGNGQLPDDAPGPARWRIYTPASVLPYGSIRNSDQFVDDQGNAYEVSAAQWTAMGYRSECIRLEM